MRIRELSAPLTCAVLALAMPAAAGGESQASATGVVVVGVEEGSPAAHAGLRPGDAIVSWVGAGSEAEAAPVGSLLDWWWLLAEQRPRGHVRLEVERRDQRQAVELQPADWGLEVRPQIAGTLLEAWQVGRQLMDSSGDGPGSERYERGAELWRVGGLLARAEGSWQAAWWLLLSLGDRRAGSGQWQAAHWAYDKALEVAGENRHPLAQVESRLRLGDLARLQEDLEAAAAAYRAAAEVARAEWGESLMVARCDHLLGRSARLAGEFETASRHYLVALEIRSRIAASSEDLAESLMGLSEVAAKMGDQERAGELRQQALSILRELRD